ncbi:MAG: peptidylprolyl isomerase [Verrucomicrobia bacterium]|nr:peptidylprolyl isomerase [Verrucomicrobiota bacterium]
MQEALDRATNLREQAVSEALSSPHFGLLAQKHSDDQATRYLGGDCGWVTRDSAEARWEPEVLAAVFELTQPGEITPVIRISAGFFFGKLIERKDEETAPLAMVRDRIKHQLLSEKRKKAEREFDRMQRVGVDVSINEKLLTEIRVPKRLARNNDSTLPPSPIR